MTRMLAILLLCTCASLAEARSIAPVEATLVVPTASVLPGVPFDMWIELHNTSETTVRVAVQPNMLIYPVDGRVTYKCDRPCFEWQNAHWQRAKRVETQDIAVIPPGKNARYMMAIGSDLSAPEIDDDFTLSKLVGHTCALSVKIRVLSPAIDELLTTNEVRIEFKQPEGDDAKVWQRMLASTDDMWTPRKAATPEGRSLWNEVLRTYPDSNYFPYAVLATLFSPSEEGLQLLRDAIRRFPDSPVSGLLQKREAEFAKALKPDP